MTTVSNTALRNLSDELKELSEPGVKVGSPMTAYLMNHRERVLCWPLPLRWATFLLAWATLSGSSTLLCALLLRAI